VEVLQTTYNWPLCFSLARVIAICAPKVLIPVLVMALFRTVLDVVSCWVGPEFWEIKPGTPYQFLCLSIVAIFVLWTIYAMLHHIITFDVLRIFDGCELTM